MREIDDIRNKSYIIINNIAFLFKSNEHNKIDIQAIDLNNLKYKALFRLINNSFELLSSTFSEGKRKYEMLYYMEKNKELLIEECTYAKIF